MDNIADEKLRAQTQPWRDTLIDWITEVIVGAFAFQDKKDFLLPNRYSEEKNYCK